MVHVVHSTLQNAFTLAAKIRHSSPMSRDLPSSRIGSGVSSRLLWSRGGELESGVNKITLIPPFSFSACICNVFETYFVVS